jgi:hypothetical protein
MQKEHSLSAIKTSLEEYVEEIRKTESYGERIIFRKMKTGGFV